MVFENGPWAASSEQLERALSYSATPDFGGSLAICCEPLTFPYDFVDC